PRNLPRQLRLQFPLIVKPRFEGSGRGIDAGAVVENKKALSDRLRWLHDHCPGAALVEEFIPEGELTVFLIGNAPSPRRFASRSEANRRCGGFANSGTKTGTDYTMPELAPLAYPVIQRPLDKKTRLAWHIIERTPGSDGSCVSPLLLEPVLEAQAVHAATTMFELLGCQDMARVDFRVDRSGKPWFLEINPLPSFDPEGTVGLLAEHMNLTYSQLIGRILDAALSRIQSRGVPHGNTQ
ncbi:MAG: hypothetical protein HYU33_07665, partial [Candidatus Omnitrophica bacterium]|nr:hypothetical protein [Candidatus Omnitrophota bacterium]